MFGRIVRFRKEDNYEDLEGNDRIKNPPSERGIMVRKRNEMGDRSPSIVIDQLEGL